MALSSSRGYAISITVLISPSAMPRLKILPSGQVTSKLLASSFPRREGTRQKRKLDQDVAGCEGRADYHRTKSYSESLTVTAWSITKVIKKAIPRLLLLKKHHMSGLLFQCRMGESVHNYFPIRYNIVLFFEFLWICNGNIN